MGNYSITVEDAIYARIDWIMQAEYVCIPEAVCYLAVMTNGGSYESKIDSILNKDEDA